MNVRLPDDGLISRPKHVVVNIMNTVELGYNVMTGTEYFLSL
jgi:hypothetical protein